MSEAEKQRDRLLDQLARQADQLMENYASARRLH